MPDGNSLLRPKNLSNIETRCLALRKNKRRGGNPISHILIGYPTYQKDLQSGRKRRFKVSENLMILWEVSSVIQPKNEDMPIAV